MFVIGKVPQERLFAVSSTLSAKGLLWIVAECTMDQRINMLFCFKHGKSAKETHKMFKVVYKDEAITSKSVYEWFKHFWEGQTSLEDAPRDSRPKTTHTLENIERVKQLVGNDCRRTK
ncbi:HTH_48 domain-containing protein [Trichonephila clavipes]|nr:HTH_48 domain-containing protein [Trichonephila clavipes]